MPASQIGWSPQELAVTPGTGVVAGQRYALLISAPGATSGCYGFTYSDANPYGAGGEVYTMDGGVTWNPESGRDLKFDDSVAGQ